MRPLFFEVPHDQNGLIVGDQFMFGLDPLLVPTLDEGARSPQIGHPIGTT